MVAKKHVIAGALILEDRQGKVAQGLTNIFDRFYQDSYSIRVIED